MSEAMKAFASIINVVNRITLIAKDGGRESGLTMTDREQLGHCAKIVATALGERETPPSNDKKAQKAKA